MAVREVRIGRELEPQARVEADRLLEVGDNHADGIEPCDGDSMPSGALRRSRSLRGAVTETDRQILSRALTVPSAPSTDRDDFQGFLEADDGARTRDPWLGKPMLYQLSYVRLTWLTIPPARGDSRGRERATGGCRKAALTARF